MKSIIKINENFDKNEMCTKYVLKTGVLNHEWEHTTRKMKIFVIPRTSDKLDVNKTTTS